jgi:hypothetical protein
MIQSSFLADNSLHVEISTDDTDHRNLKGGIKWQAAYKG